MTFEQALKQVYESDGELMCGPTSLPSDAITWDKMVGWRWLKSGNVVRLLTPTLLFEPWIVGEKP